MDWRALRAARRRMAANIPEACVAAYNDAGISNLEAETGMKGGSRGVDRQSGNKSKQRAERRKPALTGKAGAAESGAGAGGMPACAKPKCGTRKTKRLRRGAACVPANGWIAIMLMRSGYGGLPRITRAAKCR